MMIQDIAPHSLRNQYCERTEPAGDNPVFCFRAYNGDLSSKQCGSVGGEMVKRMVEQYESKIK